MPEMPSKSDLVLVAIMPSPRDLEIAKTLGWYRIPIRSAPKVVAVDYLAFYQPASFGEEHRWQIRFIARITGHELVRRAEILSDERDHPHADQEYFKMQLDELIELRQPIPTGKWKRINFICTTGERLLSAHSIQDLGVHDEDRPILWKALREKALQNQQYGTQQLPEIALEPEILAMLGLGLRPQIED